MVGNSAFRVPTTVPADEVPKRAADDAFFGGMGRGFCIKVRDTVQDEDLRAALRRRGLRPSARPYPK